MADQLSSLEGHLEKFLLEPYTPSTDLSTQCIVLSLELIRFDTRYDPGQGKHHQTSRTAGVLLVNGHFMSDTIEDYDYGWDENTLEKEIIDFKQSIDSKCPDPLNVSQ